MMKPSGFQKIYKLFGIDLFSNSPFSYLPDPDANPTASGSGYLSLSFNFHQVSESVLKFEGAKLISSLQYEPLEANLWNKLFLVNDEVVLQFAWGAEYHIKQNCIDCYLLEPARTDLVELFFIAPVLTIWLEMHGLPCLHSSAVVGAKGALVFLANSGSGKSSLASACLQAGAALLTDDILPVEEGGGGLVYGRPGLPQINLWPDQAASFFGQNEGSGEPISTSQKKKYPITAFKNAIFCEESQPLACLYIPERYEPVDGETKIEITPVPALEAMIELLRYSFIPAFICEELDLQARRMEFFARLVEKVPVRRLRYPSGLEYLPAVAQAVLRDAQT